jgi:hypothetical protein
MEQDVVTAADQHHDAGISPLETAPAASSIPEKSACRKRRGAGERSGSATSAISITPAMRATITLGS